MFLNLLKEKWAVFHPLVWTLFVGTVFARAATSMSMPFLAIYLSNHSGLSPVMIGLTIGSSALASTFGGFIGGSLSDRFGRKAVMISSLLVWSGVFAGFAFADSMLEFTLLNLLNGLCRSFFEPASQAFISDLTPEELRMRAFALRYTAINIGVSAGPLLGVLLGTISPTIPFLATGAVYACYAILLLGMMVRYRVAAGSNGLTGRVTMSNSLRVVASDGALRLFLLGGVIGQIGYSQMTVTLSQHVEDSMTNGTLLFSILMSVNALTVVILQMPVARFLEKYSLLTAVILGNLFFALGDLGFAFSWNWLLFLLSMVVFTVGEIMLFPTSTAYIDRMAGNRYRGTYFGANSFSSLGHFLGPFLGGFLLQHYGGTVLFTVMAIVTLSSTCLFYAGDAALKRRVMEYDASERTTEV